MGIMKWLGFDKPEHICSDFAEGWHDHNTVRVCMTCNLVWVQPYCTHEPRLPQDADVFNLDLQKAVVIAKREAEGTKIMRNELRLKATTPVHPDVLMRDVERLVGSSTYGIGPHRIISCAQKMMADGVLKLLPDGKVVAADRAC